MSKIYKVSYKIYFNNRLKQVYLHGVQTYPLYISITFKRKTYFFKSYFFELLSKPKYYLSLGGQKTGVSIEEIIAKEHEVINFIIEKYYENFSLEIFKKTYEYYSKDMCDLTEEKFIEYLHIFFIGKGMPALAVTLKEGNKFCNTYDILMDMKTALNPKLYKEMIENSTSYASPFLPLYGFVNYIKKNPKIFTIMEWENDNTQLKFKNYLQKCCPSKIDKTTRQVENWLNNLSKNLNL